VQSVCVTTNLSAPVGDAVYAVGVLDQNMTLLDYADGIPVTIASGAAATLPATLNGVGASVIGYPLLTDPNGTTAYNQQNLVECSHDAVAVDPQAICSYVVDVADNSGDDMANIAAPPAQAHLANALALTATDVTTGQPLDLGYGPEAVDPSAGIQQVVYDPNAATGLTGSSFNAGPVPYNAALHFDLTGIPSGSTHTVEVAATLQPPVTTAFGPNVLVPHASAATFTWDIPCRTVTVGANDPSGVAEGTVLRFCDPPSNLRVVVQ
jgi:hypothetical protein